MWWSRPTCSTQHLPESYRNRDDVPHVVRTEAGDDVWVYDGRQFPNIGLNAVAGRPRDEYGIDPTSYEEMRPGCWDVDARIGDMNANGVLASMCFPSFPRLCGQVFAEAEDKDLALVLVRAYNDWHVHSWCGKHPGRFMPLGLLPYWDVELTVAEMHRLAAMGVHAVSFSENPSKLGLPSLHSDHWDPFWAACQDLEIVPCMHIGSSSTITVTAPDAPFDVTATLQPMNIVAAAADLVWSPVLRKFPEGQDRAVGGWRRLAAVLPRQARSRVPQAVGMDGPGLRRPASERGVQGAHRHLLPRRPRHA